MLDIDQIIKIVIIVAAAWVLPTLLKRVIERLVRRSIRSHKFKTKKDEQQREDTIVSIINTGLKATFWTTAGLMILSVLGINITPLLAGAGIIGVALGFGAQSMVKDLLAGVFIIAENQYRVGDVLRVNQGVAGTVERISLRITVLRDLEGKVHYIPNGNIEIATNMTLEYANVDLNITVGYESDLDKVEQVINEVGAAIAEDNDWKDVVLEAPYMLRVDAFTELGVVVKVICKTAPIRQWEAKSEILRRLKKAFEKHDIIIPYPQRVIHQAEHR